MPPVSRKYRAAQPFLEIVVGNYTFSNDDLMLVRSVQVVEERGKPDTCAIELSDPKFEMANNPMFAYGVGIKVTSGWTDEKSVKGPFTIVKHSPNYPANGDVTFTIECKTQAVSHMNVRAQSKNHRGRKSSEIITEIAGKYGLSLLVDLKPSDDIQWSDDNGLVQSGETDARFLQRLCDRIGYDWGIKSGALYVQRPEKVNGRSTILEYRTGRRTLKSFVPELKTHSVGGKTSGKKQIAGVDLFQQQVDYLRDHVSGGGTFDGELEVLTQVNQERLARSEAVSFDSSTTDDSGVYKGDKGDGGGEWSDVSAAANKLSSTIGGAIASFSSEKEKKDRFATTNVLSDNTYIDKITGTDWNVKTLGVTVPEIMGVVRSDVGGTVPTDEVGKARHGKKAVRTRITPIKATAVPTYPSWSWSALDTVFIRGVGKNYEGQMEVGKVTLRFDNTGIHTTLELRKRTVGKKKGKNKNAKLPNGRDEGEDGSIDDPNHPRPVEWKNVTNIGSGSGSDISGWVKSSFKD